MTLRTSFESYRELAASGGVVPVVRELPADFLTPVTALAALARGPFAFLLESLVGGERWARYTFLGTEPREAWRYRGGRVELWTPRDGWSDGGAAPDALEHLAQRVRRSTPVHAPGLPRFWGGAVGFLGYDAVRAFERLPGGPSDDLELPDALFLLADTVVIIDNAFAKAMVVASTEAEPHSDRSELKSRYDEACARTEALVERLRTPPALAALPTGDGRPLEARVPEKLNDPEGVAWTPKGVLVIADTWNHRVLVYNPDSGKVRPLPVPVDGWYGPRSVGVASDGTIAAADTGHQRIVLISAADGTPQVETIGGNGSGPGELVEPVGIAWLDSERILVCDTGNRRLQVLDRRGQALEVVNLPETWSDFYSRPQVVELSDNRWLVTDVSARSLWLVEDGTARKIDLGEAGIIPTGLALDGDTLYLADLNSRVWAFDLSPAD